MLVLVWRQKLFSRCAVAALTWESMTQQGVCPMAAAETQRPIRRLVRGREWPSRYQFMWSRQSGGRK